MESIRTKKLLLWLLVLIASLCLAFGLTACTGNGGTGDNKSDEGDGTTEHVHVWDDGEITLEAACTKDGVITYTCTSCGETKTETISATGHTNGDPVVENNVAATCTENGSYESVIYCTVCSGEVSRVKIAVPATNHTAGTAVTENEVAATCTENGSYDTVTYCTVCKSEISRDTTILPSTGHTNGDPVTENEVAATCTENGSCDTVIYCTTCNTELIRVTTTLYAAGHTNGEAVIENEKAATCTENGSYDTVIYCNVCKTELSRSTITVESVGHTWNEGEVITAPTCTSEGEVKYTCTVCNYTENEVLAKTDHTAADPVVENYTVANCTENGSYDSVIYCTVCNGEVSRTEIIVPATGHTNGDPVTENEVAASCTAEGSYDTVVYCTVCKAEVSRVSATVEKIPHTYDGYKYDDTCHWQVCTVCGSETASQEHEISDSKCTVCDFSEELIYTLSDDKTYYIVSGVSSKAADMTEVNIYAYYNGLPVTEIAENAFNGNTVITSVVIADKVTVIGEKAFYGCTALKSVTIGNGVKTIGNYSFYNCTSLNEINYNAASASALSVSNYAFYCAGQSGEGITLTVGASVKTIPAYIFYPFSSSAYSPKITSLQFEDNSICTTIKTYAFYGCSALLEITIPSKVTSIAAYAFGSCTALTKIYYCGSASSLTTDAFAFAGQSGEGITVTISASVTQIPYYMFCTSGTSYAPKIVSVVFEENSKCTSIGWSAFAYCTSLKSINIPDTVTSIGDRAFVYCSSLTSVTIPDGVTTIDSWTFAYCTSLVSVNIPDSVTIIGGDAFWDCSSLTSIYIPEGVISINKWTFYGCSSLVSVIIPDSVISIDDYAFYGCYSLVNVTIGSGVMSIGSSAFDYCYKLLEVCNLSSLNIIAGSSDNGYVGYYAKNVYTSTDGSSKLFSEDDYIFYNDSGTYYLVAYTGTDTSIVLPDTFNGNSYSIYERAFNGNTKIKSLTIGSGVMSIGNYAFYNCTALTKINFNATAMGDLSSGNYVFYNAGQSGDGITVTIGANVTKIPAYLFYSYINSDYPKIVSIVFEENSKCTSIGTYAFFNCTSLTSITIPDSVTSIGNSAFSYCAALTSVTIGSGVTSIGNSAFYNCTALISVYYTGTANDWSSISIGSSNTYLTSATIYYYAENDGTTTAAGNYWYYDGEGNIKTWSIE